MKHSLLLSYCTYLSFYLYLQVQNKFVKDHPVIYKLAQVKALLDQISPLDEKIDNFIKQSIKSSRRSSESSIEDDMGPEDMSFELKDPNQESEEGEAEFDEVEVRQGESWDEEG